MITIVIFVLLTLAISYYVVFPIVQDRRGTGSLKNTISNHQASDLVERKEAIYAAIKDMEFDFEMGKLSQKDFEQLRQQYKDEAVGLLKGIDRIQGKAVKLKPGSGQQKKSSKTGQYVKFCWVCGTSLVKEDRFCVNCGLKIR